MNDTWTTHRGDTVELYESEDGWRWRVRAANNEIVGQGEAHPRRADAVTAALRHHPEVTE